MKLKLSWAFLTILFVGIVTMPRTYHLVYAAGTGYVATNGSDNNNCLSPDTPCASIGAAISKMKNGDVIFVAVGTYTGSGDQVVLIDKDVRLLGGWDTDFTIILQNGLSIIDGENTRRGIVISSDVNAYVDSFVIQHGLHTGYYESGGGISNAGILTVTNSLIINNRVYKGYGGGGIENSGKLNLDNVVVANNIPYFLNAGGIYNDNGGTVVINNSTIRYNGGEGISNERGNITINNSAIAGNSHGLDNISGIMELNASTVSENLLGICNRGTLIVNNSTISGNGMTSSGAGISNLGGVVTINSSTIAHNTVSEGGGGIDNADMGGSVVLRNTILANNKGTSSTDCQGSIVSAGYNLIGKTGGCNFAVSEGDIVNATPGIEKLKDNGGSTLTHALLAHSPAINAGNPNGCTGSHGALLTDQRGVQRSGRCDIGAYESNLIIRQRVQGTYKPGQVVTFTIDLKNTVGTDLAGVTLTDVVPSLITYIPDSLISNNGMGTENDGILRWNGTVFSDMETQIVFSGVISQAATSQVITNTVLAQWGTLSITNNLSFDTFYHAYIPLCLLHYCPDFYDDFSTPSSGWPVGEDSYVRTEYLNGEYRILSKQGGYLYLFRAPTCERRNYTVEADVRWDSTPGNSYGLIFGVTRNFSQFYLFDINTDFQMYRLYRRGSSGFTQIVASTATSAIRSGTASNHIKAIRNGNRITLEINGTELGTWIDGTITGLTGVGIISSSYSDTPISDARFDNFQVKSIVNDGVAEQGMTDSAVQANDFPIVTNRSVRPNPLLEWGTDIP